MFSSNCFIILILMFSTMVHCELMLVYSVREHKEKFLLLWVRYSVLRYGTKIAIYKRKKKWWNSTLISFKMYRISRIRLSHWSTHEAGRNCQNRLFSWNLIKTVKQPGDCLPQKETLNLCSERVVAFLLTCLSFLLPSSEVGAGTVACIFGVFCWRKKG